jgi:hypothetical protein
MEKTLPTKHGANKARITTPTQSDNPSLQVNSGFRPESESRLWVSNSNSRLRSSWELDEVPAVRAPAYLMQIRRGRTPFSGERRAVFVPFDVHNSQHLSAQWGNCRHVISCWCTTDWTRSGMTEHAAASRCRRRETTYLAAVLLDQRRPQRAVPFSRRLKSVREATLACPPSAAISCVTWLSRNVLHV